MRLEGLTHLVESRGPHPRQTLEDRIRLSFQVGVEHTDSILELRKRSNRLLVGEDAKKHRFAGLRLEIPSPAKRYLLAAGRLAVRFNAWYLADFSC